MRVWALPYDSAYTCSFYQAVEDAGVDVLPAVWSSSWIYNDVKGNDIVHIHWPSFAYKGSGSYLSILVSFIKFSVLMLIIRLKGARVWWTAHNLFPHERCRIRWIDVLGRHLIIALASKIFVHGAMAKSVLLTRFPKCAPKCHTIPHGHWVGAYGELVEKNVARKTLGLPEDKPVYLLIGHLKPYKNLEGLIEAFLALDSDGILLLAGKFSDAAYAKKISGMTEGHSNIRIDARFIPNEEMPFYLGASDAICLPYTDILTSGAAVLAMSYARPVISIDKGFMREVITEDSGVLVSTGNNTALILAMREIVKKDWDQNKILQHVSQYTYTEAASVFVSQLEPSLKTSY
ncbi:glycosyltransferase [Hahella ganghwensis]|uniref:glycosyltransferase n=1 Tax=Hahella ganghwensis TaxID=286420 RepID=UPI00036E6DA1|nr:glycosyltransferase [Hahella ganghwensis]